MARAVIVPTVLARNDLRAIGTLAAPLQGGAVIDQANGMQVTPRRPHKMCGFVYNSAAGAHNVIIRAGIYPPAISQGLGDFTLAGVPNVAFAVIPPLDGARFQQAGGAIFIDFDAGTTGVIWIFELPA